MDLFVCSSNYQLLNAISIILENQIDADLMITRESIWSDCRLNVLVDKSIFKNVYRWTGLFEQLADENVKRRSDKYFNQIKKILTYLNKRAIWDSIPNKGKQYTKVHIAYVDSITLWVYTYFKRSGSELSLFEDGTYSYGCLMCKKSLIRRLAEMFLYNGSGIEECVQMYVKHPEKVKLGKHNYVKVLSFNGKYDKGIILNTLLPLYGINEVTMSKFKRKVIIFDQNVELHDVKEIQKKIAKVMIDVFGSKNVLVKIHPSSHDKEYGNEISTVTEKFPFELVMAYEDMSEKVLISIFSTACMSPKLDYDQEPYVIFTYKLYGDRVFIDDTYLEQVEQLRNSYTDKSKIIVPNDMDEMINVVKVLQMR